MSKSTVDNSSFNKDTDIFFKYRGGTQSKREMIKSTNIDDTGYTALDLPNDDFLFRLKIIK